jgi:hypothetical protein
MYHDVKARLSRIGKGRIIPNLLHALSFQSFHRDAQALDLADELVNDGRLFASVNLRFVVLHLEAVDSRDERRPFAAGGVGSCFQALGSLTDTNA